MISVSMEMEQWELREPFEIARGVMTSLPVLLVTLTDVNDHVGRAEAAGVDYAGETPMLMAQQLLDVMPQIAEATIEGVVNDVTFETVQRLLPAGGARNAIDCALWDLRAKQSGVPAWKAAGLKTVAPLTTVFTLGLGTEDDTRRKAREARQFPVLKLKCDAERHVDVVRWVREEHPSARIAVDANQSWSRELLQQILPALASLGVELVEQPVKKDNDMELSRLQSPIPLAADESCTDRASLPALAAHYQYINIKLDKCGGLTEALALSDAAESLGLKLMVGNMCGTSLAMAPAHIIGQRCGFVDLDGPLLQTLDRPHPMVCVQGVMEPPASALWG